MQNRLERSARSYGPVMAGAVVGVVACVAVGSCNDPKPVRIGEATLAVIASGTDEIPADAKDAPVVEVLPEKAATIPDAPVVKLAIDRRVPWGQVKAIVSMATSRKQQLIFLIAQRFDMAAFHLNDELDGPVIQVLTYTDGQICVSHPEVKEALCEQSFTKDYIDPSSARNLMRMATKAYERTNAEIEVPLDLPWGDVVAAVGGARSCCGELDIRVHIKGFDP